MEEQIPKKPWYKRFADTVSSPATALSDATKHSPLITLFAIMLIVQPVIQTGIELIKEFAQVKRELDPASRPVTKAELDIVNQKIDFNNQLILAQISGKKPTKVDKSTTTADSSAYSNLQQNLTDVQKHLDADYKGQKK